MQSIVRLVSLLGIFLPVAGQAVDPVDPAAALELLKKREWQHGVGSCGSVGEQARLARLLVRAGSKALPLIEREFQRAGVKDSELGIVSTWFEPIYARILGASAFSILKYRAGQTGDSPRRRNVDHALAISLGITSYVSDTRMPSRELSCLGDGGPRVALDRVIVGWLKADRSWLETALGSKSKAALSRLLGDEPWESFHARQMHGAPGALAVGYRLKAEDHPNFSSPGYEFVERAPDDGREDSGLPVVIEVTVFDAKGGRCGAMPVAFAKTGGSAWLTYRVDEDAIGPLLVMVASCARSSRGD